MGTTTTNNWSYFTINPSMGATTLSINVKELGGVGNVWVYASQGRFPLLNSYDFSDQTTYDNTSPYHQILMTFSTPVSRNFSYYIGNCFFVFFVFFVFLFCYLFVLFICLFVYLFVCCFILFCFFFCLFCLSTFQIVFSFLGVYGNPYSQGSISFALSSYSPTF
jgi:hypothetical protein